MQEKLGIFLSIIVLLSGCTMLQPNNCDTERMKIQQLEQANLNVQGQNERLEKDNQELANTGKRTLERLATMQQRYAEMSQENRNLSSQNQELLEKLYQERLQKNEKWREENLQAKRIFDSYLPEWEAENEKARQLFEQKLSEKKESSSIEPSPIVEKTLKKNDPKQLHTSLEEKRLKLLDRKNWTIQDERKFINIIENLMRKDIPAQELQKYEQSAVEFDLELSNRLAK